jgi:hypothetical protein
VKVVVTDHHYTDIGNATRVLADAGIELVVGECRGEDDAMALGRDADAVINQHVAITARVLDAWPTGNLPRSRRRRSSSSIVRWLWRCCLGLRLVLKSSMR